MGKLYLLPVIWHSGYDAGRTNEWQGNDVESARSQQGSRGFYHDAMQARHLLSSCVCPSVRPSVGIVSKRLDEPSLFLARRLPSTYPTPCYEEIRVPLKIRVLSCGTLSQTLDLENFATASRSCYQQNSSTVEPADHTYDSLRVVAGCT